MTEYYILVDGIRTGFSLMAESAVDAARTAFDSYWRSHLQGFKQYGKFGVITAVGPIRFPDGYQEIAHF